MNFIRLAGTGMLVLACILGNTDIARGQAKPEAELPALKAALTESLAAIDAERKQKSQSYDSMLGELATKLKTKGDLDGLLAVRAEIERFGKDKKIPTEPTPDTQSVVLKARQDYRQTQEAAELDRCRRIIALVKHYTEKLDAIKVKLTKADRIEDAIAVNKEIKRVQEDQAFTSASFIVAAATAKNPEAAATEKTENKGAGSHEKDKVLTSLKDVNATGSMGDWTPVALNLEVGDIVTLDPSGSWQTSDHGRSCGPEGFSYSGGQVPATNAAALLFRLGPKGTPNVLARKTTFTNTVPGIIYFDINHEMGSKARKECSGSMKVKVEVRRKTPPTGP